MSLKAVYNKEVPTRNLVTTISGVATLAISALSLFNIITAEQAASLTEYVVMAITAVAGVISVFKATDA